ncbi:hypothetical protein [Halovulum sp. GXIMD14793]
MKYLMILMTLLAGPGVAANFDDPDWPCIQRKVEHLSLGQMWAGPQIDDHVEQLIKSDTIRLLAGRLAVRRTSEEDAKALVADFVTDHDAAPDAHLTALFAATFKKIDRDRNALIQGIGRYSRKQIALAEQIERRRAEVAKLKNSDTPDYDQIELLEDELAWDTRIFDDRRQSLTYVCETPVLLKKTGLCTGAYHHGASSGVKL